MGIRVITQPSSELLTLAEVRLHLRLDAYDSPPSHPDDPILEALIPTAREWCERYTGRRFAPAEIELAQDAYPGNVLMSPPGCVPYRVLSPGPLYLEGCPIREIKSIRYLDSSGNWQSLEEYQLDEYSEPARLLPLPSQMWPATQAGAVNAVVVRYSVGYTLPGDSPDNNPLPKPLRQAMLLIIGHLYESREDTTEARLQEIPMGAQTLMRKYRLQDGFA